MQPILIVPTIRKFITRGDITTNITYIEKRIRKYKAHHLNHVDEGE